jgi:hypothetical protein
MTFPSLRKLLYVAPLFIAVGVAAACGPYAPPAQPLSLVSYADSGTICVQAPAPSQTGYYYEPVTNPQGQTYYVPRAIPTSPPPGFSGTSLSVRDGKLQVQTADGARMSCEKLTILVNGVDPAEVSVADKLIKITSGKDVKEGSFLQASAQKVTRTSTDGAQLILEGDAKLLYVRKGKKVEVSTEVLSVNLLTGQVISELDAPRPATPVPPTTTDGPAAPPPPPPTAPATDPLTSPKSLRGAGTELRTDGPPPGLPATSTPPR